MERPKLIVFDLNKTLIHENSWEHLNMAMGVTEAEDQLLVEWGSEGIISDAEGQDILCRIYKKRGEPTRENIMNILRQYTFFDGAEEAVATIHNKGYETALITGSMDILAADVADKLGMAHYAANNEFIFDDHDILERIRTINNDEAYKLEQLERLCQELGIAVTDCMAVGDGANDGRLFEATRCGVTFSDSKVRHLAKYAIKNLTELPSLLA